MQSYKEILIIHALDESTAFLNIFEKEFPNYYISFTHNLDSINVIKTKIGDLQERSLIIYLGHGSSTGLYIPSITDDYDNYFLDINWGNHYFEGHDILLLTCRSEEYLRKMHKYNSAFGFGNIISSEDELKIHNKYADVKKILNKEDIEYFNVVYTTSTIRIINLLVSKKIQFKEIYKYYYYFINREISNTLLSKKNPNRIEIARLLFELRNEMLLVYSM